MLEARAGPRSQRTGALTAPAGIHRAAAPGNALAYGAAATKSDFACHSTQDGISCWNTKTGQSFALARGGWMTGTAGEIGPQKFSWND